MCDICLCNSQNSDSTAPVIFSCNSSYGTGSQTQDMCLGEQRVMTVLLDVLLVQQC